ncbi:hypothetical protein R1sor_018585 [Riccia sorocarpa]|uniref:Maturase K n=1 Tax=Riccia sorocarpa TaxID=122646 RepID=A0ABD3IA71_9MARC
MNWSEELSEHYFVHREVKLHPVDFDLMIIATQNPRITDHSVHALGARLWPKADVRWAFHVFQIKEFSLPPLLTTLIVMMIRPLLHTRANHSRSSSSSVSVTVAQSPLLSDRLVATLLSQLHQELRNFRMSLYLSRSF